MVMYYIYDFLGHLSDSGELLLWFSVRRRPFTSSSQDLLGQYAKFGM